MSELEVSMRWCLVPLVLGSLALAEPVTRPASPEAPMSREAPVEIAPPHPPVVGVIGPLADLSRPAYVPAFARAPAPPALYEQRVWARQNTYPAPLIIPVYVRHVPVYRTVIVPVMIGRP